MFNDAMFRSSIWSTKTIMRPSNRILETLLQSLNYHDMYVINDKYPLLKYEIRYDKKAIQLYGFYHIGHDIFVTSHPLRFPIELSV